MPQPAISSHLPSREAASSPCQRMSTSRPGSTNGKNPVRKRNSAVGEMSSRMAAIITAFMLASETSLPIISPSNWWNMGECVASASFRYTRPGQMMRKGGLWLCM